MIVLMSIYNWCFSCVQLEAIRGNLHVTDKSIGFRITCMDASVIGYMHAS